MISLLASLFWNTVYLFEQCNRGYIILRYRNGRIIIIISIRRVLKLANVKTYVWNGYDGDSETVNVLARHTALKGWNYHGNMLIQESNRIIIIDNSKSHTLHDGECRLLTVTDLDDNIQISESSFTCVDDKWRWHTGQHTTRSYTITTHNHLAGVETRQNTRLEWTKINTACRNMQHQHLQRVSPYFAFFHRIRLLCWPITS